MRLSRRLWETEGSMGSVLSVISLPSISVRLLRLPSVVSTVKRNICKLHKKIIKLISKQS